MSQSESEYESDDRSVSSRGSRRLRKSTSGVNSGLEKMKNPRRRPRNMDPSGMSAADLVFRNSCNSSADTFHFSDDESDWVTDLDVDDSESENEAPTSSLSLLARTAVAPIVKPAPVQKMKPDMHKIKPDIQKIGGSESDWFSEFSESEAEFAGQPPAKSLPEKKKKTTKGRTAGQTKREAETHQAKSENIQTGKSASKKKGKTSSRSPVKSLKHTRGRESNRGEEVEDNERSASRSVSRRPESTPKKSKESTKRSSNRSGGNKKVLPSAPLLDGSKTRNTRGRASKRGEEVEDDERSASRSVSRRPESTPKKSKESTKRSSNKQVEDVPPSALLKNEFPQTPTRSSKKKASQRNDESRRGRSPSQSDIPFQIVLEEDPADEADALIRKAKERKRIADEARRTPFCDRSLSVSRHRVRDRSRSVSRSRDTKGRNAADIPLVDDRDMGKREESGRGYLPTAYDRRKEHSHDDQLHGIKHSSDLTIKEASGRLGQQPTDGYASAASNSRPSLDGLFKSRRDHDVLWTSTSLSGAPKGKLISDSASLKADMRPNPRAEKSRSLKVDSLNWSGAMDNLLHERRQRPSTMESPHPQKPKLVSSDLSLSRQSASKLDVDSLYTGKPKRGSGANPMESCSSHEPKVVTSDRNRRPGMSRQRSASRLGEGPLWEPKPPPLQSGKVDDSADPKFGHRIGAVLTSARKHTKTLSDISGISSGISGISGGISALSGGSQPAGHSALGSPKGNAAAAAKQPVISTPKRIMNASGHSRDADRRHPMSLGAPPLY